MKKVMEELKDYFCSRLSWKSDEIDFFKVHEENDQTNFKKNCVTVFFGYTGYERLNSPCWDWVLHLQISGIILMARDLDKKKICQAQNLVLEMLLHTDDMRILPPPAAVAGIVFKGGSLGSVEDNHLFKLDFDLFLTDYKL